MEALEIIKTVIELGVAVHDAVQEVKSFKEQSKNLARRMDVIIQPVQALKKRVDAGSFDLPTDDKIREVENLQRAGSQGDGESCYSGPISYIRPLKELIECMRLAEEFLKDLSTMKWGEKFFTKKDIKSKFDGFDTRLTTLQQSLLLSLQVVFNQEMHDLFCKTFDLTAMNAERQEAYEQDLSDLEETLKQMKEKGDNTNDLVKAISDQLSSQKLQDALYNPGGGIAFKEFADLEKIEEGTFGPIYKAKHNMEDKLLVIKKYMDSSEPSIQVLKEQFVLWKNLARSRFIVQPYNYTIDEAGRMCFVLEYMHFGTLRKVLLDKKQELSWDDRLSLARDCAHGLYAIHYGVPGKTMLHRALTSTRFFVNRHLEAKIADNGFVTSQSKIHKSGTRIQGSLEQDEINYHVPEDSETEFKATIKSEIYKLGVIFYEIASRLQPFQSMEKDGKAVSDEVKLEMIWDGKVEEPPEDTPVVLKDLIKRCRSKDPYDRPSTSDVVSELSRVI